MRLCEQEARKKSAEKVKQYSRAYIYYQSLCLYDFKQKAQQAKQESELKPASSIVCINEYNEEIEDEEDAPRRRGKPKKNKKTKLQTTSTFQVSQEPETQIATLGPDSPNNSTRPSLIPNDANMPRLSLTTNANTLKPSPESRKQSSFISEDALKYLRCGLNIDVVETSFERYVS